VRELIEKSTDNQIDISYERAGVKNNITATSEVNSDENRKVIGIYMENVGVVQLNPVLALWEGGKLTAVTFKQVAVGLGNFIWQAVRGHGDFSQVSGPVGIVGMVGDAASFGFAYLLGFVAFISLNLAVINLIPFPALDGGRVLFVIIEAIIRKPIKPIIANTANTVGFFILIALMLVITYRDIMKFF
jgi:regulator of sigma E protease